MKKILFSIGIVAVAIVPLNSCGSTNLGTLGVGVLQSVLNNASNGAFSIFQNPDEFMKNALIDAALPDQLKKINNGLNSAGLGNLVNQEKKYIADAAQYTVKTAKPIVTQAINEMTPADALMIAQGGKGAATAYLKSKTKDKLMAAIQPEVENRLSQVGILKTLNTAMNGGKVAGLLGTLLGKNQNNEVNGYAPISHLAAEQMVNGFFNVVENYEDKNLALKR